ncbi:ATP-binding protein [Paenibacillus senegalensis]|uniref:ATP-binding protein n=1 Tax=Paenibacillus senegalensis TaxID=1465766 RepID=UPI0002883C10|nr:ATP-binding protein [Paenibacillus senegalensis]
MHFQVIKTRLVALISVYVIGCSIYLGKEPQVLLLCLLAALFLVCHLYDRKFCWLKPIQLPILGAFHFISELNWCLLLYYIVIINMIFKEDKLYKSFAISMLILLQYTLIRFFYVPLNPYHILVTGYDMIAGVVLVLVFYFVNQLQSEKHKLTQRNTYLANHDHLTGLLNYDGYLSAVRRLVERKRPFQLVLIDINNFKSLNAKDTQSANEILIRFAETIQKVFKDRMFGASRYAGDRFAVLLPVAVQVDNQTLSFSDLGVQITYSITQYPKEADTFQAVISTAEDRIFQMRRDSWLESQEEMLRSEKMKMVGQLAAGMAHEIRNPLTAIKGFVQLSKSQGYNIQPWYDVIMGEITRVGDLTAEFLQFSKPHENSMRLAILNECLQRVYSLCESEAASEGHQLLLTMDDQQIVVFMDPDKIIQLLLNLIRNAFQAMQQSGVVNITLEWEHSSRMAVIMVSDTGKGIPPEELPKIFDPFYTTKAEGTGLGLSICQKIVEDHRGKLQVSSQAGQGTTFTILLPLSEKVMELPVSESI